MTGQCSRAMKQRRQIAWYARGPLAAWMFCAVLPFTAAGGERVSVDASPGLRVAVSESVTGEVNGNDLRAAIKTWAEAIARQTGVRMDTELCTSEQLLQKVRNRQLDVFSLNILDYAKVAAYVYPELVMDETQIPDGEEYVLLVHQSSGIRSLADLRGRSLLLYKNTRTCMNRIWLDTLLASAHLGAADTLLGRLESNPKLSRVVLPVFFRQADACVATRRGYTTMCELNPQLATQLRTLAVSPKLIVAFLALHKDSPPETRRRFLAAVTELHKTAEGRQALMLFQGTRLVLADVSVLNSSLEMLHAYERIKGKTPVAGQ